MAQPAPIAHRVTAGRRLDLDHLGAEVAQQRAGERSGQQLSELDHPDPLQGPVASSGCRWLHGREIATAPFAASYWLHVPPPR